MRIAIFIHKEYDFLFDMLKGALPKFKKEHELIGVLFFQDRLNGFKALKHNCSYLKIFGLIVSGKLIFYTLFKKLSIFYNYILRRSQFYSFKSMCSYYGIECFNFHDPNHSSVIKWVKDNEIDVILIFIEYILKGGILETPKICILNKHSGLLPAYRGLFPVFWAMMNNDKIGVTIHKVNEKIDGGEIILQKEYHKDSSFSVYDYYKTIFFDTPDLIMESLDLIKNGQRKMYEHGMLPSYFRMFTRDDFYKFRKAGHRFV